MNKILTVIVTSYNYENFIGDTLTSLENQSDTNFNILVIDDGSKDNSVNIIKEHTKNHKNITFLQHPGGANKGLCATTQLALSHVETEYVAFCESDDYWDTDHVKNLLKFIKNNPMANMIFNKIIVKNYSSNPEYDNYVNFSNQSLQKTNKTNIFHLLTVNYMPTFSSACIKTSELKRCNFNSFVPQYLDFWLWRQLCVNNDVYYVDDAVTFWRKHDASYDMKENVSDIKSFIIASNNLIFKQIKKRIPCIEKIKFKLKKFILSPGKYIEYQVQKIQKTNKK